MRCSWSSPAGHDVEQQTTAPTAIGRFAAIWAASVGLSNPGRRATRNLSVSVVSSIIAVVSHASSHHAPVGVRTASKPFVSAAAPI